MDILIMCIVWNSLTWGHYCRSMQLFFTEELGCMKGHGVTIQVDDKVKPKFCKPRTVPFALRDKVEKELDRLESLKIISPVQHSKWAAPIVPVVKKNGTVRLRTRRPQ